MMRTLPMIGMAIAACAIAGCANASDSDLPPDDPPDDPPVEPIPSGTDCPAHSKLIYTIDRNGELGTYDPVNKQISSLGAIACTGSVGQPYSMTVDRQGNAWVLYSYGGLYRLDPTTLACTATAWQPTSELEVFGMAFAADSPGGTSETLYVAGGLGREPTSYQLAKLDANKTTATKISDQPRQPELTGTGAGELWAYFPFGDDEIWYNVPKLLELDKASGGPYSTFELSGVWDASRRYDAVAHFGGDFFVFNKNWWDGASVVLQVERIDGRIMDEVELDRVVVAAGVSTCAPTGP